MFKLGPKQPPSILTYLDLTYKCSMDQATECLANHSKEVKSYERTNERCETNSPTSPGPISAATSSPLLMKITFIHARGACTKLFTDLCGDHPILETFLQKWLYRNKLYLNQELLWFSFKIPFNTIFLNLTETLSSLRELNIHAHWFLLIRYLVMKIYWVWTAGLRALEMPGEIDQNKTPVFTNAYSSGSGTQPKQQGMQCVSWWKKSLEKNKKPILRSS